MKNLFQVRSHPKFKRIGKALATRFPKLKTVVQKKDQSVLCNYNSFKFKKKKKFYRDLDSKHFFKKNSIDVGEIQS